MIKFINTNPKYYIHPTNMVLVVIIFFEIFKPTIATGQYSMSNSEKDSLWNVWNNKKEDDTNRLKAIDKISFVGYIFTKPDTAFYYAQLFYDFAKKSNQKKYMARALNTQGISHYMRGNYNEAIPYFEKSLKIKEEINDQIGIGASLTNLGNIYSSQGNFAKAITYYMRGLKLFESTKDQKSAAIALENISNIYSTISDYPKALHYLNKCFKIRQELKDEPGIAMSLCNFGALYVEQGEKALKLNNDSIATKNFEIALNYYHQSLEKFKILNNDQYVGNVLLNLSVAYTNLANYEKALYYANNSLQLCQDLDDKSGLSSALTSLAEINFRINNLSVSENQALEALHLAKELNSLTQIYNSTKILFKIYQLKGDVKKALEMHLLHIEVKDSLNKDENKKELIRQEIVYQYEKQKTLDTAENEKKVAVEIEKQKRQYLILIYTIVAALIVLILLLIIYRRLQITKKQKLIIEEQKEEVESQRDQIEHQKNVIEEKHTEIQQSISYAKRIQNAILPPKSLLDLAIPQNFVFYAPKDVVAGDFYWLEKTDDYTFLAVADCTGHGVPGAMVSVVCHGALNRCVREYKLTKPADILDKTRELVIETFQKSEEQVKDGMDISLICWRNGETKIQFAGANNPLYLFRHSEGKTIEESTIEIIKPDKEPIGFVLKPNPFKNNEIQLQKGDIIYLFSDGYADQFGGEQGKKMGYKNFRDMLLELSKSDLEAQRNKLEKYFLIWKGKEEQLDDVCVMGIKI